MRRVLASFPLLAPLVLAFLAGCGGNKGTGGTGGTGGGLGSVDDIMASLPTSCSLDCTAPCAEPDTPFACPTLLPWAQLPHDAACNGWDGTYPTVTAGKCTASAPTGDAAAPAGPIAGGLVLPDGHRIKPAGVDYVFTDTEGGFPMSVLPLPGTHFALVADSGIQDAALRLVDVDALAAGSPPVAAGAVVPFHPPSSLFWGIAWVPPGRAYVSGGGDGVVYAFDVDTTKGSLGRAAASDIEVGMGNDGSPYFVGPVAVTPDGSRLLVGPSDHATDVRIFSLGSSDHGKLLTSVDVGSKAIWDLTHDPFDSSGKVFYATDLAGSPGGRLLEIDGVAGSVTRTVSLDKNPEQIVFLDATYAVVTEADTDEIAVVDRAAGMVVSQVPIFQAGAPHGASPNAVAWDPMAKQLYATLAGINAVEVFTVAGTPPVPAPAGRIPTAWWPTGVMVAADGALVVTAGKEHGTGTDGKQYTWGNGVITQRMHGGIQHVPTTVLADLATQTAAADQNHQIAALAGHSTVSCPSGASDFPIPADNASGPSPIIKHVILVVRENKTYDGVLGDRADLGNGDPSLIMASDATLQGKIWQNARAIAQAFTNFDNFYTDAEQSIQGHTWTVYGRTTDYMERTWLDIWGRGTRPVTTTAVPADMPQEGGVFQWLSNTKVAVEDMGEIIGGFTVDQSYPGLFYTLDLPDVQKSCYVAGRIRLRCDLSSFTYVVQPNDHTEGGAAGAPAPEVMIAVNDEASGMILDALSHSPLWKDSLLIITEDDPQDGGDHVDLHRSILLMASPWVRRGYVSHGHYDMASVYKLVAHIFGIPYHNDMIENAMAPFDAFTSTPDYTPFDYTPRKVAAPCNPMTGKHALKAAQWDFDEPDDQPGLSEQIMEMMREPRQARGIRVLE